MMSQEEGLTAQEQMARSSARKKRRSNYMSELISNKQTLITVNKYLDDDKCPEISKCLLRKLLSADLLDDMSDPEIVHFIARNWLQLFHGAKRCVHTGQSGFAILKTIVEDNAASYARLAAVFRTNYTSLTDPEAKCIFWNFCAAFFVIYYEYSCDRLFDKPLTASDDEYRTFLLNYPEFLVRTWDSIQLLYFKQCMETALRAFGRKSNMGCLVEFVTYVSKGREVALCCNTSGGGLRDLNRPTEVSTEKCRVLIYHRESGGTPRRRRRLDDSPWPDDIASTDALITSANPSVVPLNSQQINMLLQQMWQQQQSVSIYPVQVMASHPPPPAPPAFMYPRAMHPPVMQQNFNTTAFMYQDHNGHWWYR